MFPGPYTPSTTSKLYLHAREVVRLEWGVMWPCVRWPWSNLPGWSPHSWRWGWACGCGAGWGTYRITMSWSSQFEVSPLDKPHKSSDSDVVSQRSFGVAWRLGLRRRQPVKAQRFGAQARWWRGLEIRWGLNLWNLEKVCLGDVVLVCGLWSIFLACHENPREIGTIGCKPH